MYDIYAQDKDLWWGLRYMAAGPGLQVRLSGSGKYRSEMVYTCSAVGAKLRQKTRLDQTGGVSPSYILSRSVVLRIFIGYRTRSCGVGGVPGAHCALRHGNQPDHLAWQMEGGRRRGKFVMPILPFSVSLNTLPFSLPLSPPPPNLLSPSVHMRVLEWDFRLQVLLLYNSQVIQCSFCLGAGMWLDLGDRPHQVHFVHGYQVT